MPNVDDILEPLERVIETSTEHDIDVTSQKHCIMGSRSPHQHSAGSNNAHLVPKKRHL